MNLQNIIALFAGGPGSGCNPSVGQCGRPKVRNSAEVIQHRAQLKKELDKVRADLKVKRGQPGYLRKAQRRDAKILREGLRTQLRYYGRRDRLLPGMKRVGKLHTIPVQPVPKSQVKKQYTTNSGAKVTIIKQSKEYQSQGKSTDWLRKPDLYKGKYLVDSGLNKQTFDNPKEKNTFFIHNESPDRARSVEVHRELGQKTVTVIQRNLGQYGAIMDHKEVTFSNIGRASGFLMKRYGVSFSLSGGPKS
jgi:hypothetical protein